MTPSAAAYLRALQLTSPIARQPDRTFPSLVDELGRAFGDAPALLSRRERLTYRQLAERSRRYAGWANNAGVRKGDVVALLMPNRPEYMAVWLGVTKSGGVVALLNSNQSGASLAHSINTASPRHLIVDAEFLERLLRVLPDLVVSPAIWVHGPHRTGFPRIDRAIEQQDVRSLTGAEHRPETPVTIDDCALYIYTSGTTGLPKAARVSHGRVMQWTHWFAGVADVQSNDRMYCCLPMYHAVGGVLATGGLLIRGGSVVLREKFSAREFWRDIAEWDCTLFQYIGELCRYLLLADPDAFDGSHRVRMCCGNGLRSDVWNAFKERFRIPQILEFYAATEGNVSLVNLDGKPGAIGRLPSFLAHRQPIALVKYDLESDALTRDAAGHCIQCGPNEVGEAIGRMVTGESNFGKRFEGYSERIASERRIARDVFERGDAWYRTGDLMRRDHDGYFYFVDRIGESFRWKGENVATREVAEAICRFPGVTDAVVYGVTIPAHDGRAGMATLVNNGELDFNAFRTHLADCLPVYARPLFVRLSSNLDITATFKHTTRVLIREGYDPTTVSDPIYVDDFDRQAFVRLDESMYHQILSGQIRSLSKATALT
jgi:fatty-acyl-CoA synthase